MSAFIFNITFLKYRKVSLLRQSFHSLLTMTQIWIIITFLSFPCAFATQSEISNQQKALNFLRGQISSFGLIDSYVEDNAPHSYTYDNALAAMAFISAKDFISAKKILDAFLTIGPNPEGGFVEMSPDTTRPQKQLPITS